MIACVQALSRPLGSTTQIYQLVHDSSQNKASTPGPNQHYPQVQAAQESQAEAAALIMVGLLKGGAGEKIFLIDLILSGEGCAGMCEGRMCLYSGRCKMICGGSPFLSVPGGTITRT